MSQTQTTTLASWKSRKRHIVTLASGAVVEIEVPNLKLLIKAGKLPNHLIDTAAGLVNDPGKLDSESIKTQIADELEFQAHVVAFTLKRPALTVEQAKALIEDPDGLPTEDVEMLVEFGLRARDTDATGKSLSGLELASSFR